MSSLAVVQQVHVQAQRGPFWGPTLVLAPFILLLVLGLYMPLIAHAAKHTQCFH